MKVERRINKVSVIRLIKRSIFIIVCMCVCLFLFFSSDKTSKKEAYKAFCEAEEKTIVSVTSENQNDKVNDNVVTENKTTEITEEISTISEPDKQTTSEIASLNEADVYFKILTYNVAHYNKDTDIYISQERIENLKNMLQDINADFVAIQEDGMIDGNALSQYDVIYKSLYPYQYGTGGPTIYSKIEADNYGTLSYSNGRVLRYATFCLHDKVLLFISTHPVSGWTEDSISQRLIQYNELFEWVSKQRALTKYSSDEKEEVPYYDYCIVCMDSNANTETDKENIKKISSEYMFDMANGGKFGWMETRKTEDGTRVGTIDNIICSPNLHIDSVNSYQNLYNDLYSDHYPFEAVVSFQSN